jgi:5,10-methylenetetrahydromethanopterin reductase
MAIKFGLRLPPCEPVRTIAAEAARAEEAGFDAVWIPDSQMLWRDAWVTLSAVALATSKVLIGTNVSTPITRHPTVSANAITSLDELSGGRAILGIGSGDSSVRTVNLPTAKVETMRAMIQTVRSFSGGEWVDYGHRKIRMKSAEGRSRAVPIYMAATGPKMLQVAGELADGVILLTGVASENIDYALNNVRTGAERAGRSLKDLELVLGAHCYIGADWQEAKKLARPYAALFAMRFPDALKAAGLTMPEPKPMPELYPDVNHCEDWEKAVAMTDWVPDDVLDVFCEKYVLIGDTKEVIRKLEKAISHGLTQFYLVGFSSYKLPHAVALNFAKEVIPYFNG